MNNIIDLLIENANFNFFDDVVQSVFEDRRYQEINGRIQEVIEVIKEAAAEMDIRYNFDLEDLITQLEIACIKKSFRVGFFEALKMTTITA